MERIHSHQHSFGGDSTTAVPLIPIVAPLAKERTIFEVSSVEIMGYDEVK